jgi:hypothetical protein
VGSTAVEIVGLLLLTVNGYAQYAQVPERMELTWEPKPLMTRGPYAFSRHPMYLTELALWLGWAVLYGSIIVFAGLVALCVVVSILAPREERALEARFGEAYRQYRARVPRWLGLPRGLKRGGGRLRLQLLDQADSLVEDPDLILSLCTGTASRNVIRVRDGGPLDPRPSSLVCHPLAFDILLASLLPSVPLTDRGFASLSCPRYSVRLFGHSLIRYSLLPLASAA